MDILSSLTMSSREEAVTFGDGPLLVAGGGRERQDQGTDLPGRLSAFGKASTASFHPGSDLYK